MENLRSKIMTDRTSKKAFTLIELLVVIAIIALLLSILMPSLGAAKKIAKNVTCRARLKQMAVGIHLYAQDNDDHIVTQDWHTPRIRTDYWYVRISKYLDNTGSDNKLGKFMRCPSGQAAKDYKDEFSFNWTAVDYGLKSWPAKTSSTSTSIVYTPNKLADIRTAANFAFLFDFFYGNKEIGTLAGGSVFKTKWDNMVNNKNKPEYRDAVFRHGTSEKKRQANIAFADTSVVSFTAEQDNDQIDTDGWAPLSSPDWDLDMHQN